jgi:arginase
MPRFAIIDAPSILGLKPTGVEHLPEALKAAGLQTGLNAEYAGRVEPLPYNPQRDPETLILNPDALRTFSLRLPSCGGCAPAGFPSCWAAIAATSSASPRLETHRKIRAVFVDGHADFYQRAEPTGEVASMDLAIISGRVPMSGQH